MKAWIDRWSEAAGWKGEHLLGVWRQLARAQSFTPRPTFPLHPSIQQYTLTHTYACNTYYVCTQSTSYHVLIIWTFKLSQVSYDPSRYPSPLLHLFQWILVDPSACCLTFLGQKILYTNLRTHLLSFPVQTRARAGTTLISVCKMSGVVMCERNVVVMEHQRIEIWTVCWLVPPVCIRPEKWSYTKLLFILEPAMKVIPY